jgi:ATP synthase in type III secretion protein N
MEHLIAKLDQSFVASKHAITNKIDALCHQITQVNRVSVDGRLISAKGSLLVVSLPKLKVGEICQIIDPDANVNLLAEVIALDGKYASLMPYAGINMLSSQVIIKRLQKTPTIKVGDYLLGSIVNGFAKIIEPGTTNSDRYSFYPLQADATDPLTKPLITKSLSTGVAAIDLFITCGVGQRLAIVAPPGVGKTTLIGMILRNSSADVVIIALIGERSREVREFIDLELDPESRKKCVLVVATSETAVGEQVQAALVAHTIAEYFRDQGKQVVLFLDSITRYVRARREIALSSGEQPVREGFPSSVFIALQKLLERCGTNQYGSITAFYTVLTEGDAVAQDTVADEVKGIVDGHIILTRQLATQNHYPAIDISQSISRVIDRIIPKEHLDAGKKIRILLSKYKQVEFLLQVGEYKQGSDALADEAIKKYPEIMRLVHQTKQQKVTNEKVLQRLLRLAQ